MDFSPFDRRHYPTLEVREGYAAWARSYESVVQDEMDLRLLERLEGVAWVGEGPVLDLACGTGRIGVWLRSCGVGRLEGVDFTQEMLAQAEAKRVYDRLVLADVSATGLTAGRYRLLVQSLADEHMADLRPLYSETARLVAPGGTFVIVGYHPHFLMNGIPTHFDGDDGQPRAILSHVHLLSDHVKAAMAAGWQLAAMEEGIVDDAWIARKPKWERYRFHPVSFAFVWRRPQAG
jgi:SAM-dependent methyltransferase